MAYGLSPYLANKLLDVVRGVAFTPPAAIYGRLHTGDPGALGTANLAAGDTTRRTVAFAAASGGSIVQSGAVVTFTNTTATNETVRAVSYWDAPTGGNLMWTRPVPVEKLWGDGDNITLSASSFSLAPLAA